MGLINIQELRSFELTKENRNLSLNNFDGSIPDSLVTLENLSSL